MEKVKEGKASLLGVSKQESKAIMEVLKKPFLSELDYWYPK
nr:competence pheromone ComX [Gracilibacillus halotolerans]